jgi:CBS domain-containing protein
LCPAKRLAVVQMHASLTTHAGGIAKPSEAVTAGYLQIGACRKWPFGPTKGDSTMKVRDCMSTDVELCGPSDSVRDVANKMRDLDCGVIPIAAHDSLVGVVTDRDIALRVIGNGLGPETPAEEAMSAEILYCFEDQDIDEVSANMAELKVRRMPVVDDQKRLCGIISLSDIVKGDGAAGTSAFQTITERGGPHSHRPS